MKNGSLIVAFAFLIGSSAFAQQSKFSALKSEGHEGGHGRIHQCMEEGWDETSPTDEQDAQLAAILSEVRAVVEANKPAMHEAHHALMGAWKKHPVMKDEVVAAEAQMSAAMAPVKAAMRDAGIGMLNLLDADQRALYDSAFMECMHSEE